jgi:hypothetical protein
MGVLLCLPKAGNQSWGHSLVEYMLPSALLVTLIVGTTTGLSDSVLNNLTGGLMGSASSGRLQVMSLGQSIPSTQASSPPSGGTASGNPPTTPPPPTSTSTFPPNYPTPTQLVNIVETAGASGATQLMSNYLVQLATSLKNQGKVTDAQFQTLQELSNAGFEISNLQRAIKDHIDQVTSIDFVNMVNSSPQNRNQYIRERNITYNGNQYSIEEIAGLFDSDTYQIAGLSMDEVFRQAQSNPTYFSRLAVGSNMAAFYRKLDEAFQNGALADDLTKRIVYDLAYKIAETSDLMAAYFHGHDYGISFYGVETPPNLDIFCFDCQVAIYGHAYRNNNARSGQICVTGNGTVSDDNCD